MHLHYFLKTATAVLLTIGLTGSLALAQTPNVVINGQTMSFDQPPIEQAGRVYVPLRGVFERLGATVVYQAGLINATAGNTEISLRVGSNQATVAGQTQYLDAPPIQIGGRVLVPLRFVSQALGATVNYDPNSATVYVTQAGNASQHVGNPPPPPPHPLALLRREPDEHATVGGLRPEVSASFSQSVDPNSLRIYLDGRDVTGVAYVSDRSFSFSPAYDLPAG
ncbi:MAG TPA: copper amine oxidase N-terminal domain-containing protein, partial [Candidatus Baltobacteraceae bacterium]|nr:copper amine oxidase N-terminal domain-containing protein [Candidatus Baltobacteraceae bacterium]